MVQATPQSTFRWQDSSRGRVESVRSDSRHVPAAWASRPLRCIHVLVGGVDGATVLCEVSVEEDAATVAAATEDGRPQLSLLTHEGCNLVSGLVAAVTACVITQELTEGGERLTALVPLPSEGRCGRDFATPAARTRTRTRSSAWARHRARACTRAALGVLALRRVRGR